MRYVTEADLKIVVDDDTLEVIHQSDSATLDNAERVAIEEVSGYLRSRFDIAKEFTKTGTERNDQVLLRCSDIMLYHLISWQPRRLGWDIREIRYNQAVEWLQDVQEGKIVPSLPQYESEDGSADSSHYRMQYGSIAHQPNIY